MNTLPDLIFVVCVLEIITATERFSTNQIPLMGRTLRLNLQIGHDRHLVYSPGKDSTL